MDSFEDLQENIIINSDTRLNLYRRIVEIADSCVHLEQLEAVKKMNNQNKEEDPELYSALSFYIRLSGKRIVENNTNEEE